VYVCVRVHARVCEQVEVEKGARAAHPSNSAAIYADGCFGGQNLVMG